MARLVAYCRVSSDKEAEVGTGLDVQEAQEWAEANGHEVAAVLRDEGISGTASLEAREALPEALPLVEDGW